MGVGLTVFATPVCLYNFWCYQMYLYYSRHGRGGGSCSGIPGIGSVFHLGAVVVMPESISWGIAFLVLYAMDAEGLAGSWYFGLREWWDTGSLPR